jgi:hypothetical protein
MTTVVQQFYRPTILPGLPGMISDMSKSDVTSRLCETAAGIGFGLAVSYGVQSDSGCVIGGANFIGISVRDITLNRVPIDPLAALTSEGYPVDTYLQRMNMGVMTRGHIWVRAGATAAPGGALFYNAAGVLCSAAGGSAASAKVVFTQNPTDGQTITIQGTVWTFKASGATGAQTNIGGTLSDTLVALAAGLNASADANVVLMSYAAYPTSPQPGGASELHLAVKAPGTAGNAYTLVTNVPGATVTGFAGGTGAATAIVGGFWQSSALAGDIAICSLGIQK